MYKGKAVYIHVAQGSGLCSCHSNTKSVQCIRVATTTREVSAVTVSPLIYARNILTYRSIYYYLFYFFYLLPNSVPFLGLYRLIPSIYRKNP